MANTSSRTLRLLSLLQTRRYWPGAELAERLEVSARTLRRDIDRLRDSATRWRPSAASTAGTNWPPAPSASPGPRRRGGGGSRRRPADGHPGGARRRDRGVIGPGLAKIVQVMPSRLRRRVDALAAMTVPAPWGGPSTVDPGDLTSIAQACRDTERLEFAYTARDGARQTAGRAPPPGPARRRWYLVAWDMDRSDWRSFRLDRLTGFGRPGRISCPVSYRPRCRRVRSAEASTTCRRDTGRGADPCRCDGRSAPGSGRGSRSRTSTMPVPPADDLRIVGLGADDPRPGRCRVRGGVPPALVDYARIDRTDRPRRRAT